jgi:hypothetical protein
MKQAYIDIRTRIETECTSIKWVRLFNNQFERSNNDEPEQNDEQAFPYPCAFIEFIGDNEQISAGAGSKRLNVDVRIHIGFESYELEDLEMFDIVQEVMTALEGYKSTLLSPLTYLAQRMDYNHNNVYIYELEFNTIFEDDSNYFDNKLVTSAGPHTLLLNKDLDIDNIVIRTGDGT